MPSLRYGNYYISVFDDKSGKASCVPFVEVRHKRDRGPEARLMVKQAYSTASDASARGFELGKQWVDEQVAQRNRVKSAGVTKKAPVGGQPIRFRFKSWFASLLLGFG